MPAIVYPSERRILEYLAQFIQRFGYAPTLREIGKGVGLKSVATVHEHVSRLENKGLIKKWPGEGRGIEIIKQNLPVHPLEEGVVELPILGFLSIGSPLQPHTDENAYFQVSPDILPKDKPCYVLQIKGEAFVEDGIFEDDYIVVVHREDAVDGDLVIVTLPSGSATMKRIYFETKKIKLLPAHSTTMPIYATEVKIQGKVLALVRKYN